VLEDQEVLVPCRVLPLSADPSVCAMMASLASDREREREIKAFEEKELLAIDATWLAPKAARLRRPLWRRGEEEN